MTVRGLQDSEDFSAICMPDPDREICGAYIGDLLSWVMGRAKTDNAWITIMSSINVIAVATLADVSCIILAEGVEPDGGVCDMARAKGVNILSTPLSAYDAAVRISELI